MEKLKLLLIAVFLTTSASAQFTQGLGDNPGPIEEPESEETPSVWISGISLRTNFNAEDNFVGIDFTTTNSAKGWSIIAAFDARPFKKKILVKEFNNQFFQMAENRFVISAGAEYFRMIGESNFGFFVQGNLGYTFGDYGGTKRNPESTLLVIPRAGFLFDRVGWTRLKVGYEYFNPQTSVISSHRAYVSLTIKFKKG